MINSERISMYGSCCELLSNIRNNMVSLIQNLININLSNKTTPDPTLIEDINFLKNIINEKFDPLINDLIAKISELKEPKVNVVKNKESKIIKFPLPDESTEEGRIRLQRLLNKKKKINSLV